MIKIYVLFENNWTDLDLYGNESIRITKGVLEVRDITKRTSTFSRQFRLPGTSINNRVFNHIFKINVSDSTFDPKQKVKCLLTNNEDIIIEGFLKMERMYVNSDRNDYEVVIYTALTDLASTIREKTLKELNLNEYNHDYTYENVEKSWYKNLFDGDVVYPFISYGVDDEDIYPDLTFGTNTSNRFDDSNSPLPFTYFKPAIRASVFVRKIIEEAGFKLKSNFIEGDYFNSIYMPLSFSDEYGPVITGDNTFLASSSVDKPINTTTFNKVILDTLERGSGYDTTTGEYTFNYEGQYRFRYSYDLYTSGCCDSSADIPDYILQDYFRRDEGPFGPIFDPFVNPRVIEETCNVDGNTITKELLINVGSSTSSAEWRVGNKLYITHSLMPFLCFNYTLTNDGTGDAIFTFIGCQKELPQSIVVNEGQTIGIVANYNSVSLVSGTGSIIDNGPVDPEEPCDVVLKNITFECLDAPAGSGSTITIEDNMDDGITQLDFLKSIFTYFNMVVEPDPEDPTILVIEPWKDWVVDGEIRDWTQYINTIKDITIQPIVDNENRYVLFTDNEDDDVLNQKWKDNNGSIFGELLFDSGSDILTNTKKIETIFAPTPSENLLGSSEFIVPKLYEEDADKNQRIISTLPRLLHYHGLKDLEYGKVWYVWDNVLTGQVIPNIQYPRMLSVETLSNITSEDKDIKTLTWNKVLDYYTKGSLYNSTLYGGSLYETYWKEYMVDIYDSNSRFVTGYFNLPLEEFKKVRMNDKILLGGIFGDTIWRINKIVDYDVVDNEGQVKVELIKVLNNFQLPLPPEPTPTPTATPNITNYQLSACLSIGKPRIITITSNEVMNPGEVWYIKANGGNIDYCFEVLNETTAAGVIPDVMLKYNDCETCQSLLGENGDCLTMNVDVSGLMDYILSNTNIPTATPTPIPTSTPTPTPTATPIPVYSWNIVETTIGNDPCVGGDEYVLYGLNPNFLSNDDYYFNPSLTNEWIRTTPVILLVDDTKYEWDGQAFIANLGPCVSPTATPTPTPTATPTPTPITGNPVYSWNIVETDFSGDPCMGGDEYVLYGTNSNFLSNDSYYFNSSLTNEWIRNSVRKIWVVNDNVIYEWDGQAFIGILGSC